MVEIDKLMKEFNECNQELIRAKEKNSFHEAGDMASYMLGLTKGMTIILDSRVNDYMEEDRKKLINAFA